MCTDDSECVRARIRVQQVKFPEVIKISEAAAHRPPDPSNFIPEEPCRVWAGHDPKANDRVSQVRRHVLNEGGPCTP